MTLNKNAIKMKKLEHQVYKKSSILWPLSFCKKKIKKYVLVSKNDLLLFEAILFNIT